MKFKKGDILEFNPKGRYSAIKGARAICIKTPTPPSQFVEVEWIQDEKSKGQRNGGYAGCMFTKVGEQNNIDKIRIFKKIKEDKVMKVEFDFVEGIERIQEYLKNSLKQDEEFLFRDVKLCNDKDDLKQVILDFELSERRIEQAIECLDDAGSIFEVLRAVEDTTLSGLDEQVIGLLFNVEITML